MRLPLIAAVAVLGAAGCMANPYMLPPTAGAPNMGAYASAMGPQCVAILASTRDATCRPAPKGTAVRQPGPEGTAAADNVWAQSRANLKSMCQDPAFEVELAKIDKCLEDRRAAVKFEQEQQAARLPDERTRLEEVRGDARYTPVRAAYRSRLDALRDAREEVGVAQRSGHDCSTLRTRGIPPPSCGRYRMLQTRVSRAENAAAEAREEVSAVLQAHRIDPRDAEELGLVP